MAARRLCSSSTWLLNRRLSFCACCRPPSMEMKSGYGGCFTPGQALPCNNSLLPSSTGLRSFAKAKKARADDDLPLEVDIYPKVKESALGSMQAATDAVSRELVKLRTGRASTGMLDHIMVVDSHGVRSPLNHVAAVTVLDQQTLRVMPYDISIVKDIEKGIRSSPLNLNPVYEGTSFSVTLPKPTKESIEAVKKVIGKAGEAGKQSIRRARQNAMDSLKKFSASISKDNLKRHEKEIEELTKKNVKLVEDMCEAKEKEITFF